MYMDGAWVLIASNNTLTCPVHVITKYIELAVLSGEEDENFLFRAISFHSFTDSHKLRSGKLSYLMRRNSKVCLGRSWGGS